MKEKKILIRGIESNFKIKGEGKPLLILHGWGAGSDSWVEIIKRLSDKGYKVICPDFPGFGKSQTPPNSWSITDYVNWLSDFINYFNLDKSYLVGHSFGGRIAVKFSADYPEKIEKLILISPAGIKMKFSIKTLAVRSIAEFGNLIFNFKCLRMFKDIARGIFYVFLRKKDYIRAKGIMRETIKKVIEEDLSSKLSKINSNTLIIWGRRDKIIPIEYADTFKKNIKDSKLEILTGVGHNPHLEVPEKLSEIIIQFLPVKVEKGG